MIVCLSTDIDQANDNSGLIGAGIVGLFILVVLGWYIARLVGRRFKAKRARGISDTA
jgi:high-affinity nickel-transport protein